MYTSITRRFDGVLETSLSCSEELAVCNVAGKVEPLPSYMCEQKRDYNLQFW